MRRNKQVQARDLVRQQQEARVKPLDPQVAVDAGRAEYPRPPWWREDIHGPSALAHRQDLRQRGLLNAPIRRKRARKI